MEKRNVAIYPNIMCYLGCIYYDRFKIILEYNYGCKQNIIEYKFW